MKAFKKWTLLIIYLVAVYFLFFSDKKPKGKRVPRSARVLKSQDNWIKSMNDKL